MNLLKMVWQLLNFNTQKSSGLSLKIHSTRNYIKKHFNEPYHQGEMYYIMEAENDINANLGTHEKTKPEDSYKDVKLADEKKFFFDYEKHIYGIPSTFYFKQLIYKWNVSIRLIKKYGYNFMRKDVPRFSSSVSFSFLIHIILIASYFGIAKLEKPVELPIREISFVDLSEEKIELTETKEFKNVSSVKKNPVVKKEPELILGSDIEMIPNNMSTGKDKLFLDSKRKQLPIKIDRFEPVAENVNKPINLLKLSIAKGTGKDDDVARPVQINLNKGKMLNLESNFEKSNISAVIGQKGSEIILNGKIFQKPITNPAISLKSTIPKTDLNNINVKPKSTQTYITGPLANRAIINKIIPSFPHWAKIQGVGASISLRFTVMENGTVKENIIIERTSGSSEWDRLVVQSLKKWKFEALQKSDLRQDQTGMITFQFVI